MWGCARACFGSCLSCALKDYLGNVSGSVTLDDGTINAAWDPLSPLTRHRFSSRAFRPTLEVVDMRHVVEGGAAVGALCWWMTRWRRRWFSYAKEVARSIGRIILTKRNSGGQGRMLGGAICGPKRS